jgi:hypothetical protein
VEGADGGAAGPGHLQPAQRSVRARQRKTGRCSTASGWPTALSLLVPAQAIIGEFLKTFAEFPPRQTPASFSIDQALEKARAQQKAIADPSIVQKARRPEPSMAR